MRWHLLLSYDSTDRLTGQTDDARTTVTTDDEQWSFIYRPAGWLDTRTLTKGTAPGTQDQKSVRTYFDNGQLQTLKNYDGLNALIEDHTLTYTTGTGAGIYQNGNRVGDTFKRKQADGTATCWTATCAATWAYDGRDRLVSENDGTPSATTTTFTLDVIGNTTQEVKGSTTTTRAYTGQQLTSSTTGTTVTRYVYDPYGNTDCVVQGRSSRALEARSPIIAPPRTPPRPGIPDPRRANGPLGRRQPTADAAALAPALVASVAEEPGEHAGGHGPDLAGEIEDRSGRENAAGKLRPDRERLLPPPPRQPAGQSALLDFGCRRSACLIRASSSNTSIFCPR